MPQPQNYLNHVPGRIGMSLYRFISGQSNYRAYNWCVFWLFATWNGRKITSGQLEQVTGRQGAEWDREKTSEMNGSVLLLFVTLLTQSWKATLKYCALNFWYHHLPSGDWRFNSIERTVQLNSANYSHTSAGCGGAITEVESHSAIEFNWNDLAECEPFEIDLS